MDRVYNENNECCGCTACKNICTRNAITMVSDKKGFLYPEIDKQKCIDCNLCRKVCPMLSEIKEEEQIQIYASKSKNENLRSSSSSGGVFGTISEYVLKNGGIVFGAIFDNEFKVIHSKARNLDELEKIKRSKYVQSDLKEVFKEVKEELKKGKEVLFSGTPCQISGLKNYIGENNGKNLYLIDIVCHGVPSPKIFEDYKNYLEEEYKSKIVDINFRHKEDGQVQKIKIEFENGEKYISSFSEQDYMYKLFLTDLILRDSCYECKFKNISRAGDISLADFWGIEKSDKKDFDDKKGVSLVLINTEKGNELFNNLKDSFYLEKATKEECVPYNCLRKTEINNDRDIMWEEYFKKGFTYIAEKYCK